VSTSEAQTDFDHWIAGEYAAGSPRGFTAFIILVKIGRKDVTPLASTWAHIVGDETRWGEMTTLLSRSGKKWDAVAFFARRDARDGGPLDEFAAKLLLRDQEDRVREDRLVLNAGSFFDAWGRRLRVDEA
jgi:hypothetical protein